MVIVTRVGELLGMARLASQVHRHQSDKISFRGSDLVIPKPAYSARD